MESIKYRFVSFKSSLFLTVASLLFSVFLVAQQSSTSIGISLVQAETKASELAGIVAKNIGPSVFSGRVTDLDVNPDNTNEFYVAYATGGLWFTSNNGSSYQSLFDQEASITIGDIAVDWKSGYIIVGTGEQNSSRSSYAGNGIYLSKDKGKTWTHLGLDETHHTGKVMIDPTNPKRWYVAALGHLYTHNPERGVFITEDEGATWKKTLFINDSTGVIDMTIDPQSPNIVYASAWERTRKAWNFKGAGAASGIYKSIDSGRSWTLVTKNNNGFPSGEGNGRIGLDVSVKDGKTYLYAVIDNNARKPVEIKVPAKGKTTKEELLKLTKEEFLKLEDAKLKLFLSENGIPDKYTVKEVKSLVEKNKITVENIAKFNDNANSQLFDTPVIGAEVYVSEDGGATWRKTHKGYLDDVYFSYGYYFGQIRCTPNEPQTIYIYGVPMIRSTDGGATWTAINGDNVHVDHHSLWVNPKNPSHLVNGNDGGVNISYDAGLNWLRTMSPALGQFYSVNVDYQKSYHVYAGAQDNGVWMGDHNYTFSKRWEMTGAYPYKNIMGGDGMQTQIDKRDNTTIYTGFQFGNYFRINKDKGDFTQITPSHDLGEQPYRWNWQTPILLSSYNDDILYMCSNFVHRSMNQGKDFATISPDLTNGGKAGNVPFGTITTIDESRLKFGLLYVGTDDGNVQMSRDGGSSWQDITKGLPANLYVSRVKASYHDQSTVYVSLNGYREDDFNSYLYISKDYGYNWENHSYAIPNEAVNVFKDDPKNDQILYVGTDRGVYISMDDGKTFEVLAGDMPKVPVHDVVVQEEANDLIIGTHGRSMYKISLDPIYELAKLKSPELAILGDYKIKYNSKWGKSSNQFAKPNNPSIEIEIFAKVGGKATLELYNAASQKLISQDVMLKSGYQTIKMPLEVTKTYSANLKKQYDSSEWSKENDLPENKETGINYLIVDKPYTIKLKSGKLEATKELSVTK